MGIKAMAKKIGCSEKQAKIWKAQYFKVLGPGYQRAMRSIERKLRQRGWIENMFGRRYWLNEDVSYIGWNYLCQGSAGDYVKFRQLVIEEWVDAAGIFPILSTHDDICFEIPLDKIDAAFLEPLFELLERGDPFGIPLPMKVQIGRKNYAEMEDFERVKKEEAIGVN
jgi:DNA polymerase I-like protein with 3'-5' exonuclease and polymerase domains